MEAISSNTIDPRFQLIDQEETSSRLNVTGSDSLIQSTYLTEILDLASLSFQFIQNYRKNKREAEKSGKYVDSDTEISRTLENIQNISITNKASKEREINRLKKEIAEIKNKNRGALNELTVKAEALENISKIVLTPYEYSNTELEEDLEKDKIKTSSAESLSKIVMKEEKDSRRYWERAKGDEVEDLELEIKMLNISHGMLNELILSNDNRLESILSKTGRFTLEDIPMLEEMGKRIGKVILDNQHSYGGPLRYEFENLIRRINIGKHGLACSKRKDGELTMEERATIEKHRKELIEMKDRSKYKDNFSMLKHSLNSLIAYSSNSTSFI